MNNYSPESFRDMFEQVIVYSWGDYVVFPIIGLAFVLISSTLLLFIKEN